MTTDRFTAPDDTGPPPADTDFIVQPMTRLTELVRTTRSVDELVASLAHLVVDELPPITACGISLLRNGRAVTVASSGPVADTMDAVQNRSGQGPCLQTLETGEIVVVSDLRGEQRWPEYVRAAGGVGPRSSISIPMLVDGEVVGTINSYADAPGAITPAVRRRTEMFATQAAGALGVVSEMSRHIALSRQLEDALSSRSVIDQAIGIVMSQQRCTPGEAFTILRTHSQNSNTKLRTVAADLVARVSARG